MSAQNPRMEEATITTHAGHTFKVGDVVHFSGDARLWNVLKRPRVRYVMAVTPTTLKLAERRMTWAEWREAVWIAIRYWGA